MTETQTDKVGMQHYRLLLSDTQKRPGFRASVEVTEAGNGLRVRSDSAYTSYEDLAREQREALKPRSI